MVYTVVVPNCTKAPLMAKTAAATGKESVLYTDMFTSYKDLSKYGEHVPVNHQEAFGVGAAHIYGIEVF